MKPTPSMLGNRSLVLFDSGDEITVTAGEEGIRFLLVSGRPLEEPVAWYGPIVMNTRPNSAGVRRAEERHVHQASLDTECDECGGVDACRIHAMKITRRNFVHTGAAAGIGLGAAACNSAPETAQAQAPAAAPSSGPHPALAALKPMTGDVKPITRRSAPRASPKAQQLMAQNKISALFLEGGSSMFYFTGVRWGLSERPFVCVLPAKGEAAWVCPGFEEERARELVGKTAEVRVWQEDESPYRQIAGILKDRGAASGRVGVEERLRFFIVQRREERKRRHRIRRRRSDHRRLPHDQERDRAGADAEGQRHHDRSVPRRVPDLQGRHDAGRAARQHRRPRIACSARRAARRSASASSPRSRTAASSRRS